MRLTDPGPRGSFVSALFGRSRLSWLVRAALVAIAIVLIVVFACSHDDESEDGPTAQPPPASATPESSPVAQLTHTDGLCVPPSGVGVSSGDAWTLIGTVEVSGPGADQGATETVTTFVVDRIEDAQWSVEGRQVLVPGSKAAVRSTTWTKDSAGSISADVEESSAPTIQVKNMGPMLTLDWECHKRAWLDGWSGTERARDTRAQPSVEETTLDSGLTAVVFSVNQVFDQSGDGTVRTVESRIGYDKATGRLVLSDARATEASGSRTTVTESKQVLSPQSPAATITALAPVESVGIEYGTGGSSLVVVSGLPDSCWSMVDDEAEPLSSDSIQAEVNNALSIRPGMACAEIYRTVTTNVPLTGVEACKVYTANVNGAAYAVQAIGPNVRCAAPEPQIGQEQVLAFGDTVRFEDEGLRVGFLDLKEDSRCPSDVTCIQAGQATIIMDAAHDASRLLGGVTVTIGAGEAAASAEFQGYTITLLSLEPYPISTQETGLRDYVATVVVTKE